ncbi:MAG: YihY/virulence factor BrkB family protein [Actinomycetota bacterium]
MPDLKQIPAEAKLRVEKARASHGAVDVAVRTFKRFSEDDCGFYAAALTYYVFFSIFPLLIFAAAVLGLVSEVFPGVREDLLERGFGSFPLVGELITPSTLDDLEGAAGRLALLSIVLALYSGSGAIVALAHALNKIHRVEDEGNLLGKRLAALKWLVVFAVTLLGSLVVAGWARFAPGALADVLGYALGLGLNVAIFATAFKFLPHFRRSFREVMPGALIAGAIFELLKYFGTVYLDRGAAARSATFGAFATAAGLLVASYLLAQITLLAAEVNAVLAERRVTRQSLTTG